LQNPGGLAITIADIDVFDYLAGKGEAEAVERLLRRGAADDSHQPV
jgi:hypothetical protein